MATARRRMNPTKLETRKAAATFSSELITPQSNEGVTHCSSELPGQTRLHLSRTRRAQGAQTGHDGFQLRTRTRSVHGLIE